MRNLILATLAAVTLGSAAMVPQADARCWWNGFGWHCWYPHAAWWGHRHWRYYGWHWRPYAWQWRDQPYAWRYY